jgi:hypothetical protein
VYTTTSTDKVGIGTSTPEFKLSLDGGGGIIAKGTYGSDTTLITSGSGTRLIWYPRKAAFRAGRTLGNEWNDANIGDYSTAMGYYSAAAGEHSTAMGYYSKADSRSSMAIGGFNVGGGSQAGWFDTDPLFEIGNGTNNVNRANALTVLKNGNVGIGIATPGQKLQVDGKTLTSYLQVGTSATAGHVLTADASGNATWQAAGGGGGGWTDSGANVYTTTSTDKVGIGIATPEFKLSLNDDGGIIAKGSYGFGLDLSTSGSGTRLIWYPKKAAFRVGYANGSEWDNTNIGNYSTAMGSMTTASGQSSTALGEANMASGNFSTAIGQGNVASAMHSTAMGFHNSAAGDGSTVMGAYNTVSSELSVVAGKWNVGGGSSNSWQPTDPLVEIGIGEDESHKANAVTVLKNGMVGIGPSNPSSTLDVAGDIETESGNALYFGDPSTNGSWRIMRGGNNLNIQRREAGSWVTKGTITP